VTTYLDVVIEQPPLYVDVAADGGPPGPPGPVGPSFGFNVMDYGAVGDGSNDDTSAIIATIAALPAHGGVVYFPPGVFRVTSTITIDGAARPVIIQGSGQGTNGSSTRILWVGGASPVFVVPATGPAGMGFRDLMIDNAGTGTIAIQVDGVNSFTTKHVLIYPQVPFSDCGIALGTTVNVVNAALHDTMIRDCVIGMRADGVGSHIYGVGFRCVQNSAAGLVLGTASKTVDSAHFYGGTFEGKAGSTAVRVVRVRNASFDGAYFEHGGAGYAIDIPSTAVLAWAISVNGCFFAGNDGSGPSTHAININLGHARLSVRDSYFVGYANPSYMVRNQASGRLSLRDNDGDTTGMAATTSYTNVTSTGNYGNPAGNEPDRVNPFAIGTGARIAGHLSGTAVWNPPSLAVGTSATTTVAVPGAAVGDTVTVGFNLSLENMTLTAFVDAPNVVVAVLFNGGVVPRDLANGTLRVDVWKH
jgi:hypothetical protein